MSSSRILIVLGIVGGFAVGTGLAIFLMDSPSPAGNGLTAEPFAPASIAGEPESPIAPSAGDPSGPVLRGAELVERFWTCLTNNDDAERQRSWLGMLGKLNKDDALEVRNLFRKMDKQGRWFVPEWDAFWARWGVIDGAGAIAHVEQNEEKSWQPYFAEKLLRGWAQTDSAAATEWLRAHRDSPMYGNAVRGFVDGFAKADLDRATQFILAEDPKDAGPHLSKFAESLTERALQQRMVGGMETWFTALPESPTKSAAVDHVAFRLYRAEPARAMEWVAEQATKPWRSDKAISDLADKATKSNPQQALAWVSKLPPSAENGRYNGLSTAVQGLAKKDPAAVETWLAQPTLDPVMREQGTATYTLHLLNTNSPDADAWLERVSDKRALFPSFKLRPESEGTFSINGRRIRIERQTAPPPQ